MFDTGLEAPFAYYITNNEKRYIIRQNPSGVQTVWIPVETTVLTSGFESAWQKAASEYLEEALIKNGLLQGWVKIVDVVPQ
jgi:hypothetical protein